MCWRWERKSDVLTVLYSAVQKDSGAVPFSFFKRTSNCMGIHFYFFLIVNLLCRLQLTEGSAIPLKMWRVLIQLTVVSCLQFHSDFCDSYLLTPWCRVLLEKLTGLQLVKKFPRISRNPKVHYGTHKRPPPVSILGQPIPVHIPTSHLLEIHPNIIHPSTPRSPQWFFPSGFLVKDNVGRTQLVY